MDHLLSTSTRRRASERSHPAALFGAPVGRGQRSLALGVASLLASASLVALAPLSANAAELGTCVIEPGDNACSVFTASGGDQTFTVPRGVTTLNVSLRGAGGEASKTGTQSGDNYSHIGGTGGSAVGKLAVVGGSQLVLTVGDYTDYSGGGNGSPGLRGGGGDGGGLTAIWKAASFTSEPLLIAGGGGGAAGAGGGNGGTGGGLAGGDGQTAFGPASGGGTQTAGGQAGGPGGQPGAKFKGGDADYQPTWVDGGGGGGAGYYGGGGSESQEDLFGQPVDGGGGGGSGYVSADPMVLSGTTTVGGGFSWDQTGQITLSWNAPAPVIVAPAAGADAGQSAPISGTAEPGNTVTVKEGATTVCTAIVKADRSWSCTPTVPLTLGAHNITATQTDLPASPLVRYPTSTPRSFNAIPVAIYSPTEGALLFDSTPAISGGGVTGETITVKDEAGNTVCTAPVVAGSWSCTPTVPLSDGPHTLQPVSNGVNGTVTGAAVNITIATTPLTTNSPTGPKSVSGSNAQPNTVVIAYDENSVEIGRGLSDASGNYTINFAPGKEQANGVQVFVTQVDSQGTEAPYVPAVVDANPPAVPKPEPSNGMVVRGTAEALSTVTVYAPDGVTPIGTAQADAQGKFVVTLTQPVSDKDVLKVTAKDALGNESAQADSVVDMQKPDAPQPNVSDGNTVTGTAEANSLVKVYDANMTLLGEFQTGPTGVFTVPLSPAQANGTPLKVTATDAAGNESDPADTSVVFKPAAPTISSPLDGAVLVSATPTISGQAEAGSALVLKDAAGTVVCTVDPVPAGGTWSCVPTTPFAQGAVTLTATATNAGGFTASTPVTVTIDLSGPKPNSPNNGSVVTGTAPKGTTVTVYDPSGTTVLGTGTADPQTGAFSVTLNAVQSDGLSLKVTATDQLGTESAQVDTLVDRSAPTVQVAPFFDGTTVTGVTEPGATVRIYDRDGVTLLKTVTADSSGAFTAVLDTPIEDGTELFVTAADALGNTSAPAGTVAEIALAPDDTQCVENADGTITCSGTGTVGDIISILDAAGQLVCTVEVPASGAWSCSSTGIVRDRPITVKTTTPHGFTDRATAPVIVQIPKPVVAKCVQNANGTVTCAGTGVAGYTVTVTEPDGNLVCSDVVAADASWSCTSTNRVSAAALTITMTDGAGGVSAVSGVPVAAVTTPAVTPAAQAKHTSLVQSGAASSGPLVMLSALVVLLGAALSVRSARLRRNA